MAKTKSQAPAPAEVAGLVESPPEVAAAPALPRYRVTLNCPTPLRDRTLVVEAAGEPEARARFDEHNGICGSVHPYDVREVEDGEGSPGAG